MAEVILMGEPMALFVAETVGPLSEVEHFSRSLAGAEVNVCTGLVRLGHTPAYITKLGKEPMGEYIYNFLKREKIDTTFISFDDNYRTGLQLKSKVTEGDPAIAYYRKGSAASQLCKEDMEAIDFTGIQHVHVTGIPPALSLSCREATYRLIERAKDAGIFLTFDPNLRPMLWESREKMIEVVNDLASRCDMVLPGTAEGLILCGSEDPAKIADFYQALGVPEIIVKLGKDGAYVRTLHESYVQKGFAVKKVVDTVGAGDGFAVGIISGRLEGLPLRDCVIRGNAIGSIQVEFVSDNEGLPNRDELAARIATYEE
ncbi:sugar kinase [Hydrogenoanaerobacterium sp.]|uniref:sugar kinase n=1 Tax=Hydrogenoanaerobacterium sp. TaxID=2953763 RepID=UPI00289D0C93|nr:sugar kinase [Hydrogenoanaerobacterium sp.]